MIKLKPRQILEDIEGNTYEVEQGDFIETNAKFQLTDVEVVSKLVDFIRLNPFPLDDQLHEFAESNGLEANTVEQYAYALLTVFLTGGKSKGQMIGASTENLNIGNFIEQEHSSLDMDYNHVIDAMQKVIICKIRSDHLAENPEYYTSVKRFTDELNQETMFERKKRNSKK